MLPSVLSQWQFARRPLVGRGVPLRRRWHSLEPILGRRAAEIVQQLQRGPIGDQLGARIERRQHPAAVDHVEAMAREAPLRGAEGRERPASRFEQRKLALERLVEHDLAHPVANLTRALGQRAALPRIDAHQQQVPRPAALHERNERRVADVAPSQ